MRSYRFNTGLGLLFAAAGVAAACSGDVAPAKGQLMVVLQSDMAIPKDFNRVQVQISVLGKLAFSNTYIADDAGAFTLPGTIAVVAGEEAAPTVEVQVVGIDRQGAAQTFSKVVTTLPRERIATLRVPIQWLCTGQVTEFGQGADKQFVSKCMPQSGKDRSCVAGSCTDVNVDEETLPAYVPTEVFGGGEYANDPSGKCFDVQGCFQLGVDLAPDLNPQSPTFCQASLVVPENYTANFAMNTGPLGAGVCDENDPAAPCYVVLDQSETFGWSALQSSQLDPGKVDDVPGPTGTGGGPSSAGPGSGTAGTSGRAPGGAGGAANSSGGTTSTAGQSQAGGGAPAGGGTPPYVTSGNWHGDIYTNHSSDSVIMLDDPHVMGFPICVQGFVNGSADSSNYALVGFNLAQEMGGAVEDILPENSQGGVYLDIANDGGSPLRVELNGLNAQKDPNEQWCSQFNPTGGVVPWSSFMNQCWTGDGALYSPTDQPLASIQITVPGSTVLEPFSFCINDISEGTIQPRRSPPQQAQSLPDGPGVKPQQTGGGEVSGTVVVQFPFAVCEKMLADPTLKLSATAACEAKTESMPICGPWSSVSNPHVPDPGGMLPDEGVGGAGGDLPGAAGASSGEGGAPAASGGSPNLGTGGTGADGAGSCQADPHEDTTPLIASFDSDQPTGTIDPVDGREGRVFSVSYGQCPATVINSAAGGANASLKYLHFQMQGSCTMTQTNMVKLVVPLSATAGAGQSTIPASMCAYDAAAYTGVSFWAKGIPGQLLKASLLSPDTLAETDAIPGGVCQAGCTPTYRDVALTAAWQEYTVLFAGAKVDPGQLLGLQLQPTASSEVMFDIDEVSFFGGAAN